MVCWAAFLACDDMSAGAALLDAQRILAALNIQPGMHVADLGAGRTGHFAFRAGEAVGEEGRVYAVDILPAAVEMLRSAGRLRGALNVRPVWGDAERHGGVPLENDSVDVALLVHVLSTASGWDALVAEARRLVRPSGRIVVIDWENDRHPLARPVAIHEVDRLFAEQGCRACAAFVPSRWHWGRVYAS